MVLKWSDPVGLTVPPPEHTLGAQPIIIPAHLKMTSPVAKAMMESYALMVMVMGTFFVYFCGMVWAFCNPKLSEAEETCATDKQAAEHGDDCWVCAPNPPKRNSRCACTHVPAPPYTAEGLTQTTYVNFWDDTDNLLSDCTAFCREDDGTNNQIGHSPSWTAQAEKLVT